MQSKIAKFGCASAKNIISALGLHELCTRKEQFNLNDMAREERNMIGYTVALISEFANHFAIRPRQAYAYMKRFKGLQHLHEHYAVVHTQSFPDTIEVLAQVCANNGGGLR